MEIVLDTNILISSLLKDGLTRKIIFLSPFEMYTVEHAKSEIEIHREELLLKSKLDEKSFDYLNDIIFSRINLVPMQEIEPFRRTAENIMQDIDLDDTPFLALALSMSCQIWSNDDHFKKQSVIRALTTNELLGLLRMSI